MFSRHRGVRSAVTALCIALGVSATLSAAPHKTERIIFVMTDGLRWQEIFRGADQALMNKENGDVTDIAALRAAYWRDSPEARRSVLMPFLWSEIGKRGQIYGNRDRGSDAFVTNGLNFSYPGYSETLCGFADSRVNSNDKILNPNITVLEWLNKKQAFRGRIAAFGAWDLFPFIFNAQRAAFSINSGWEPFLGMRANRNLQLLNQLKTETPKVWPDEPFDALPFYTAIEYLKARKPRVLYLSFGETDDWAHDGKYAKYLEATHRVDEYVRRLWEMVQGMSEYRGKTTLIFSPDHGRGEGPVEWKKHGEKTPDSKYIWMAFLGPDTPPLGERFQTKAVRQNQIAATLASLLGEDYRANTPQAGGPILEVLSH